MEQDEKVKTKSISFYPSDVARLRQIGRDNGVRGLSGVIRWLINDWERMKEAQAASKGNGRVA